MKKLLNFLFLVCFLIPGQMRPKDKLPQPLKRRSLRSLAIVERLRFARAFKAIKKTFAGKALLPQEKKDLQRVITYSGLGTSAIALIIAAGFGSPFAYKKIIALFASLPDDERDTATTITDSTNTATDKPKKSDTQFYEQNVDQDTTNFTSPRQRRHVKDVFAIPDSSNAQPSQTAADTATDSKSAPEQGLTSLLEAALQELKNYDYSSSKSVSNARSSHDQTIEPSTPSEPHELEKKEVPMEQLNTHTMNAAGTIQNNNNAIAANKKPMNINKRELKAAAKSKKKTDQEVSDNMKKFGTVRNLGALNTSKNKKTENSIVNLLANSPAIKNAEKNKNHSSHDSNRGSGWDEERPNSLPTQETTSPVEASSEQTAKLTLEQTASKMTRVTFVEPEKTLSPNNSIDFKRLMQKRRGSVRDSDKSNGTRHFTEEETAEIRQKARQDIGSD